MSLLCLDFVSDPCCFPEFLFLRELLEESMAIHSSTLAWRILWREEPGSLQSMGSHRVGQDWSDLAHKIPGATWNPSCNLFPFLYNHLPSAAAAAKSLQSCPTLCDPIDGSPPVRRPWDFPGKNSGVGCHFFLQCMKVKSESEVAQSCLTLSNPMDCSPPGSSVHGIFQARVLEWGTIAFSASPIRAP